LGGVPDSGRDRTAGADSEEEEGVSVIWQRGHGVRRFPDGSVVGPTGAAGLTKLPFPARGYPMRRRCHMPAVLVGSCLLAKLSACKRNPLY